MVKTRTYSKLREYILDATFDKEAVVVDRWYADFKRYVDGQLGESALTLMMHREGVSRQQIEKWMIALRRYVGEQQQLGEVLYWGNMVDENWPVFVRMTTVKEPEFYKVCSSQLLIQAVEDEIPRRFAISEVGRPLQGRILERDRETAILKMKALIRARWDVLQEVLRKLDEAMRLIQ